MAVFEVTLNQLWRGQTIQNVLHFRDLGSGSLTDPMVADAIVAGWLTSVKFIQVNELSYIGVKVQRMNQPDPPFIKTINILGSQGASSVLFTFSCFVLQFRTVFGGRAGRGRCYIAGHVAGAFVNGLIEVGQKNFWNNQIIPQLVAAHGASGSSGLELGIMPKGGADNTFKPVSTIEVRSLAGVQRRRNLGTGI